MTEPRVRSLKRTSANKTREEKELDQPWRRRKEAERQPGPLPAVEAKPCLVRLGPKVAFDPRCVISLYVKPDNKSMVIWFSRATGITVTAQQVYDGDLQAAFDKITNLSS